MTGWSTLLRTFLRRDRRMILLWAIGVSVLYWSQAASVQGLYATQAEFDRAAAAMSDNAAFIAMAGPDRALNTIGGQVAWQATAMGAVVAGLMSMFLVVRHTRAEEESGREELLRAAPVGRHATTVATAMVVLLANACVAVLVIVPLVMVPLTVVDSLALGIGVGLCGLVFGSVALVGAQVFSSPRSVLALSGAAIAAAYACRAIGDLGTPALSWISPIGWYQGMHAFSGLRWWPGLLLVAAALLGMAVASVALTHRDFGSGIFAARPGPARAAPGLRSGLGLAWRLQRGPILGWALGMVVLGLAYGSLGDGIGDLIGDSAGMLSVGGGDLVDGFYAMAAVMLALIATGFVVTSALRTTAEEAHQHVELLLATGLSRTRWWAGHLVWTAVGATVVTGAGALGLAGGYAMTTADGSRAVDLFVATAQTLSPLLVVGGSAVMVAGWLPGRTVVAWVAVAFSAVILLFGTTWRLPDWLVDLSPFSWPAAVPLESFALLPVLAGLLAAGALAGIGWVGWRRRDLR